MIMIMMTMTSMLLSDVPRAAVAVVGVLCWLMCRSCCLGSLVAAPLLVFLVG